MSSFIAAAAIVAVGTTYTANEARLARSDAKVARKDAEAIAARTKAEEDKKQQVIDDSISAEKKRSNEEAFKRLKRKGYGGTVLGGKKEAPTLLGSVG